MIDEAYILTAGLGYTRIGIGTDAPVLLKLYISYTLVLICIHNPAYSFTFGGIHD